MRVKLFTLHFLQTFILKISCWPVDYTSDCSGCELNCVYFRFKRCSYTPIINYNIGIPFLIFFFLFTPTFYFSIIYNTMEGESNQSHFSVTRRLSPKIIIFNNVTLAFQEIQDGLVRKMLCEMEDEPVEEPQVQEQKELGRQKKKKKKKKQTDGTVSSVLRLLICSGSSEENKAGGRDKVHGGNSPDASSPWSPSSR